MKFNKIDYVVIGLHCYAIRRCRFALEMEKEEMTHVTVEEPLFVKEKGATSTDGV